MSDCGTMCATCNRASNGEQYCRKCEAAIEAKERADEERGFALPAKVDLFLTSVVGSDGEIIAELHAGHTELLQVIADAINEHYSDETEGA